MSTTVTTGWIKLRCDGCNRTTYFKSDKPVVCECVKDATAKELEALCWLFRRRDREVNGGALLIYYEGKARVAHLEEHSYFAPGTQRRHAWRRQSGTLLGRLYRKCIVDYVGSSHGVPRYKLSDKGRAALDG